MKTENIKLGHLLSKKMKDKKNHCLSENILSEFIENKLLSEEKERVFEHLNSCRECFEVFEIASSLINDQKKDREKNLIKPLSIAASIVFVFLLGFYYSNFYKPEIENLKIYEKIESKSTESPEETYSLPEKTLSIKAKDKKTDQRKEQKIGSASLEKGNRGKTAGFKITRDKNLKQIEKREQEQDQLINIPSSRIKSEKTDQNIRPAAIDKKQSLDEGRRDTGKSRKIAGGLVNETEDEEFVRRQKAPLKKLQKVKAMEKKLNKRGIQRSNKETDRSGFSILLDKGYIYRKKNYFGKLTKDNILILLAEWKKLLPDLNGIQKDIALETISYLQNRKQEIK